MEIRVGIETRFVDTVKEIRVISIPLGRKERGRRMGMFLPMSEKIPRNLRLFVLKTCSLAFSTKLKGLTMC